MTRFIIATLLEKEVSALRTYYCPMRRALNFEIILQLKKLIIEKQLDLQPLLCAPLTHLKVRRVQA